MALIQYELIPDIQTGKFRLFKVIPPYLNGGKKKYYNLCAYPIFPHFLLYGVLE